MYTITEQNRAKFSEAGTPGFFPGITTLCHLPDHGPEAALHKAIIKHFVEAIGPRIEDHYVALPAASYHMTVLDVATYHKYLADSSKEAVQDRIIVDLKKGRKRFLEKKVEIEEQLPIKMKIDLDPARIKDNGIALEVPVIPFDSMQTKRLVRLRDILADVFEIELKPDYVFHITLYYPLHILSEQRLAEVQTDWQSAVKTVSDLVPSFEISHVELCRFENMNHFEVVERISATGATY